MNTHPIDENQPNPDSTVRSQATGPSVISNPESEISPGPPGTPTPDPAAPPADTLTPLPRGVVKRESIWTESLAIGSAGFVERIKPLLLSRKKTEVIQTAEGLTVLQESPVAYGQESDSKNGAHKEK